MSRPAGTASVRRSVRSIQGKGTTTGSARVPEERAGTATGPGGRSRLYRRGLKERRRRWSRRCLRIKGAASRNEAPLEGHECIIVFVAAGATPPTAVRIVAASVVLRSPFALSELPSAPGHGTAALALPGRWCPVPWMMWSDAWKASASARPYRTATSEGSLKSVATRMVLSAIMPCSSRAVCGRNCQGQPPMLVVARVTLIVAMRVPWVRHRTA
jgi:hypothetical protein